MVDLKRRNLVAGFLASLLLSACVYDPYYRGPARPVGYYDYYYYPSIGVYFHYHTGYYYYRSGPTWYRSRTLPSHYRLDYRDRRVIHVERGEPYIYYDKHRQLYKPYPKYHPDSRIDRGERDHNFRTYEKYNPGKRKH